MIRILIATDGKPHSDLAVRAALILGSLDDCSVTLLTVVKKNKGSKNSTKIIDKALGLLADSDITAETKTLSGEPAEEIANEAQSGSYDLVVLGQRPNPGLLARLFGPVTGKVIEHVSMPVLIVKEPIQGLNRLLLCDSGANEVPLLDRFSEQLPQLPGFAQEVTILHVMSQIGATPGIKGVHLRATAEELIADHSPEGALLERDIEKLEDLEIRPQVIVRHGLVVDEIIEEAAEGNYDLVVIGAHRQESLPHFLLDDLAGQIIRQISQSVLVIQ